MPHRKNATGRYVFTFGSGHTHPVTGERLDMQYVLAPEGMDRRGARRWMLARFGIKWADQYPDVLEDYAGIVEFGLTECTNIPEPIGTQDI